METSEEEDSYLSCYYWSWTLVTSCFPSEFKKTFANKSRKTPEEKYGEKVSAHLLSLVTDLSN